MRIIIIIQSIVLVLAVYYIYLLRQDDTKPSTDVSAEIVLPPPAVPPLPIEVPADETITATTTPDTPIAGPNDAGMEFPTLEVR
ncbi:MAG: hypothetical protein RLZZ70_844 [Candidatus Parcubacteria bacterium]